MTQALIYTGRQSLSCLTDNSVDRRPVDYVQLVVDNRLVLTTFAYCGFGRQPVASHMERGLQPLFDRLQPLQGETAFGYCGRVLLQRLRSEGVTRLQYRNGKVWGSRSGQQIEVLPQEDFCLLSRTIDEVCTEIPQDEADRLFH